eukprot:CAMPEP_0182454318 /NCGR_PEP_ID=MMETSP1319-20130603/1008_1 /TAXON_ID=172717 /ORGANISM="Bolidomonas pacifica, Strain RCC208" /LENGTH=244 /DNA_ID=CAMNT_0024652323 /DNA_START=182 /DNA_END=912 /DNA_ORIENTATION=-
MSPIPPSMSIFHTTIYPYITSLTALFTSLPPPSSSLSHNSSHNSSHNPHPNPQISSSSIQTTNFTSPPTTTVVTPTTNKQPAKTPPPHSKHLNLLIPLTHPLTLPTGTTTVSQWMDNYSTQVFLQPGNERWLTVRHTLHTVRGRRLLGKAKISFTPYHDSHPSSADGRRRSTSSDGRRSSSSSLSSPASDPREKGEWQDPFNTLLRVVFCYLSQTSLNVASARVTRWQRRERREVVREGKVIEG